MRASGASLLGEGEKTDASSRCICYRRGSRFLKVTHALIQLSTEGALPSSERVKADFRHVLTKLLDEIVKACRRDSSFISDPDIQSDMDFLSDDGHWSEMVDILSDLGSGGRYHDLDTLLDGQSKSQSPLDRWNALEMRFWQSDPAWEGLMKSDQGEFARRWYPALAAKRGVRPDSRAGWSVPPCRAVRRGCHAVGRLPPGVVVPFTRMP